MNYYQVPDQLPLVGKEEFLLWDFLEAATSCSLPGTGPHPGLAYFSALQSQGLAFRLHHLGTQSLLTDEQINNI